MPATIQQNIINKLKTVESQNAVRFNVALGSCENNNGAKSLNCNCSLSWKKEIVIDKKLIVPIKMISEEKIITPLEALLLRSLDILSPICSSLEECSTSPSSLRAWLRRTCSSKPCTKVARRRRMVAASGFKPLTNRVWAERSIRLSYAAVIYRFDFLYASKYALQ